MWVAQRPWQSARWCSSARVQQSQWQEQLPRSVLEAVPRRQREKASLTPTFLASEEKEYSAQSSSKEDTDDADDQDSILIHIICAICIQKS
jgi:hypothetical protein